MEYTHNADPEYYNIHPDASNCGSFAFNLKEWYNPEEYVADMLDCFYIDEIEDEFLMFAEHGYNEEDLMEIYTNWIAECVMQDFEGTIRYIDNESDLKEGEELVELRTFVQLCDASWCNHDFHFRVLRDGIWMEKCGSRPVTFCDERDWGEYESEIVCFAHRVA